MVSTSSFIIDRFPCVVSPRRDGLHGFCGAWRRWDFALGTKTSPSHCGGSPLGHHRSHSGRAANRGLSNHTSESFASLEAGHGKVDAVICNPKNGIEVIGRTRKLAPDIQWMPLINMPPEEIHSTLIHCKLYVDFGHPPKKTEFLGKQRYAVAVP